MADAIDHTIGSKAATACIETAKGVAVGLAVVPVVGAALLGLTVFGIAAATGGIGLAAVGYGLGGAAVGGAVGAAAEAFAWPVAAVLGGVGALVGLGRGGSRIGREQHAFDREVNHHQQNVQVALVEQRQMGRQEGLKVGAQYGFNAATQQFGAAMEAEAAQTAAAKRPVVGEQTAKLAEKAAGVEQGRTV